MSKDKPDLLTPEELKVHMSREKAEQLLTVDELKAIEAEVQKELDKEVKAKARDTAKEDMLRRARVQRGLDEPYEFVVIDLPEHSDRVTLNGVAFMQGREYEVRTSVAQVLREVMGKAWLHQATVDGHTAEHYIRRNTRMSGATGRTTNAPLLRG